MNRQTLADVLQSTNQTGSYTLATVLEGAEAGSQLLLRDGDALWQTQSAELLQRQLAVLQACTATGFLTLEGQRVFAERFGAVPQLVVCGGGHVAAWAICFCSGRSRRSSLRSARRRSSWAMCAI